MESQRPWDIGVGGGIVAVAGELRGTMTFGATTVVAGATDGFVVALDADDGSYLWHWVLDSGEEGLDYGYSVAVAADGTVYTLGDFDNSVTIGGFDIVGGTFGSTYVARLSRTGALELLSDLVGLFGRAELALGPDGLYVSSEFRGSYDFGSGTIVHDSTNPFLLALDFDAAFRWVVSGDGPDDGSSNGGNGIDVAPDGSPWMLGSIQREITFAGTRIVNLDEPGTSYFAHLAAADGAPVLVDQLDGLGGEYLSAIDFAADGRAMLTGSFSRTFERDGTTLDARTDSDLIFVCLDAVGALCAARGFGGPGRVGASDIAAGASGDAYIVGAFNDTVDFGGTTLMAEDGDGAWFVMHLVL
jgi:outer membrane protein assembly factor BamB